MKNSYTFVWIKLSYRPLLCYCDGIFKSIGDKLGRYITISQGNDNNFSCARICVEMDFAKGILEAIQLDFEIWSHLQVLYYKHNPFKCNFYHGYGHFAKNCRKSPTSQSPPIPLLYSQSNDEQWGIQNHFKEAKESSV